MKYITRVLTTALFMSTLTASYAKASAKESINPLGFFYDEHPCGALAVTTSSVFTALNPRVITMLGQRVSTLALIFTSAAVPYLTYKCIASMVKAPLETPAAAPKAPPVPPQYKWPRQRPIRG